MASSVADTAPSAYDAAAARRSAENGRIVPSGQPERAMPNGAGEPLSGQRRRRRIDFLLLSNEGGHLVIAWIGLALALLLIVFWSLTRSSS
jgi:hypothetical protein